jgi:hypothetical protein
MSTCYAQTRSFKLRSLTRCIAAALTSTTMLWVRAVPVFSLVIGSLAQQQALNLDASKHAITPAISELAEQLLPKGNISGLSIGVVHSDGIVELEGWGVKSEDGDKMTPDVSFSSNFQHEPHKDHVLNNNVRHCFILRPAPRHFFPHL